ncbi:uncharacterized protein LOC5520920 isoform X2 [Nematostella vectensis]|uniref:uncharacterized protein LOC5520920 isoform X2 n=1 Tax=Nematostella vectensis TaxID=45351 RepID=UPI0020776701|nr:uncharacterized protein LOC5520920 isoform X2 [Nematostella vectensis]
MKDLKIQRFSFMMGTIKPPEEEKGIMDLPFKVYTELVKNLEVDDGWKQLAAEVICSEDCKPYYTAKRVQEISSQESFHRNSEVLLRDMDKMGVTINEIIDALKKCRNNRAVRIIESGLKASIHGRQSEQMMEEEQAETLKKAKQPVEHDERSCGVKRM